MPVILRPIHATNQKLVIPRLAIATPQNDKFFAFSAHHQLILI